MSVFVDAFVALRSFFEAGGDVLWAILAVTTLMWTLIIERLWFISRLLPTQIEATISFWRTLSPGSSWQRRAIRKQPPAHLTTHSRTARGT